jgi:DNA polymerase IV (DinB-like DNA polymerase)
MARSTRLPGTASDDREQVVCHVDADCFYAACERLREPALRGEPVVVGMGYEPGDTDGAVATASYEAREYGVESAQAISTALDLLPRKIEAARDPDLSVADAGFYRPVEMDFYESVAGEVKSILRERAGTVREVSVDEAYLDASEVGWEAADDFARRLKAEIESEVGVTVSVGVAPTMSAAKVASDLDKPDGLVVVEPGEVADFFAGLDVEAVHGVGPVTAAEFREMGIETAGDLAAADPDRLAARFGERGRTVRRYARGEDDRAVEPTGRPKSLSRESAFSAATDDPERQRERVRTLAAAVADRADRKGALYRTIGVKAVRPPFDVNTRAESLPGPVADADLLRETALDLFAEFAGEPVRKVGVRVSNLSFAERDQASLASYADADGDGQAGDAGEGDGTAKADGETGEGVGDEQESGKEVPASRDGQWSLEDF